MCRSKCRPAYGRIADINTVNNVSGLIDLIDGFHPHVIGISLRNIDNVEINDTRSFLKEYRDLVDTIRKHSRLSSFLAGVGSHFPEKNNGSLEGRLCIIGEGSGFLYFLPFLSSEKIFQPSLALLPPA